MFDIVIVAVGIIAFVRGYVKGIISELAGFVALILGVYGAARISPNTQAILEPLLGSSATRLVAFGVSLVFVVIAVHLIAKLANKMARMMELSFVNKLLGGSFRVARIMLIISCVLGVVNRILPDGDLLSEDARAQSVTYGPVCVFADFAFPYIEEGWGKVKDAYQNYPTSESPNPKSSVDSLSICNR